MFKRFNNKQLSIVLAAIVALYILTTAFGGKAERTFKKTLAVVDTAKVSQIMIAPPQKEPVQLMRNGNSWQVALADGNPASTAANSVKNVLQSLAFLEARQLVSRDEDQWNNYKVDSTGTRVQIMGKDKQVLDIVLGKFEYKQTGMMSYVRLYDEDEIYLVSGYLDASFNKDIDGWRDKTLIKGNKNEWAGLTFTYPADSSFALTKDTTNKWVLADGTPSKSTEIDSYLSKISNSNGTAFVNRKPLSPTPVLQLVIQTSTGMPIEIKAFPDSEHGYLLSSSLNPGAYFAGDEGGLIEKFFIGKTKFISSE